MIDDATMSVICGRIKSIYEEWGFEGKRYTKRAIGCTMPIGGLRLLQCCFITDDNIVFRTRFEDGWDGLTSDELLRMGTDMDIGGFEADGNTIGFHSGIMMFDHIPSERELRRHIDHGIEVLMDLANENPRCL